MAVPIWTLTYTIQDAKKQKGQFSIYFPTNSNVDVIRQFAISTGEMVQGLVGGVFMNCTLSLNIDLGFGGNPAFAEASSDVEEIGYFVFETSAGSTVEIAIPTMYHFYWQWDYTPPPVNLFQNFIDRMIEGLTVFLTNVSPSDNRGADIVRLRESKPKFYPRKHKRNE